MDVCAVFECCYVYQGNDHPDIDYLVHVLAARLNLKEHPVKIKDRLHRRVRLRVRVSACV